MATINIPGAPTDVTPSIAESGVDINAANQGLGQTIQGYDNLMNMQFRDMDRAKLETNRAALLAQEAAFHANLDLPKQMIENQKQNIESTNKIAALEEAKNAGQLTQDAKIYTVNQMSNINAGLMDYQKQALSKMGPDGSGYTLDTKGWLLAQGQNAINNAPNSQAKVSMYLALHQLGNQVMQQGFQVEQKAKFDYNIKQSQDPDSAARRNGGSRKTPLFPRDHGRKIGPARQKRQPGRHQSLHRGSADQCPGPPGR